MDPEEPLMSEFAMTIPNGTASVLVQELADHGLSNSMNDSWIRGVTASGAGS